MVVRSNDELARTGIHPVVLQLTGLGKDTGNPEKIDIVLVLFTKWQNKYFQQQLDWTFENLFCNLILSRTKTILFAAAAFRDIWRTGGQRTANSFRTGAGEIGRPPVEFHDASHPHRVLAVARMFDSSVVYATFWWFEINFVICYRKLNLRLLGCCSCFCCLHSVESLGLSSFT